MKILADENVHVAVVGGLRGAGWQVEWIARTSPSTDDEDILARPDIADWVLLTFDSDFGDLIFHRNMPVPQALIYSRLARLKPETVLRRILAVLADRRLVGHSVTLVPDDDRYKPFAGSRDNG